MFTVYKLWTWRENRKEQKMQTIDEVKAHCRDVGKRIEKAISDGVDLGGCFEGQAPMPRFKVDRDGNDVKVVGGELGGDDSHIVVSERGVTKTYGDEIVGYAFDHETAPPWLSFSQPTTAHEGNQAMSTVYKLWTSVVK